LSFVSEEQKAVEEHGVFVLAQNHANRAWTQISEGSYRKEHDTLLCSFWSNVAGITFVPSDITGPFKK